MRQVPRNIDAPNRMPEHAFASIVSYYGAQYIWSNFIFSIVAFALANYIMYRMTIGKPEGAMYRFVYKMGGLGQLIPSPKKVKKFEI